MPVAPTGSVSRIHRWAARSWADQPSHRVGASGPTDTNRSHKSARSDLANVTSEHSSARHGGTRHSPVAGNPARGGVGQEQWAG